MKKRQSDPDRENRIHEEIIVTNGPEEQAMGWYYYLETSCASLFRPGVSFPMWFRRSSKGKFLKCV
jgi:calcium binding protein